MNLIQSCFWGLKECMVFKLTTEASVVNSSYVEECICYIFLLIPYPSPLLLSCDLSEIVLDFFYFYRIHFVFWKLQLNPICSFFEVRICITTLIFPHTMNHATLGCFVTRLYDLSSKFMFYVIRWPDGTLDFTNGNFLKFLKINHIFCFSIIFFTCCWTLMIIPR